MNIKMRCFLFVLFAATILLMIVGVQFLIGTKSALPANESIDLRPTAEAELNSLNNWDTNSMDVASCSEEYSRQYSKYIGQEVHFVDSGETNGWIAWHARKLAKLGYKIHWNCETGKFEAAISEKRPANICACQRTFTTPTPP